MDFQHFDKLKQRYCDADFSKTNTSAIVSELQQKKSLIENREFGKVEDEYVHTTQIKIIVSGLFLKIYHFLEKSIHHTSSKDYISAIAIHRLCLEHIVMASMVMNQIHDHLVNEDYLNFFALLHTFCMGERIYFVEAKDREYGGKRFSTRAEHVGTALRVFDKKYRDEGYGVQLIYDMLSNHSHVSPTSSLRMLYRQKIYNVPETKADFSRVNLSTISNSNEKLAVGMVEYLYSKLLKVIENDKICLIENRIEEYEKFSKLIELKTSFDSSKFNELEEMLKLHDKAVQDFRGKLDKYSQQKLPD
jgi:hypothetical protein